MKTTRKIATRMQHIEPFHVMDILARASEIEAEGKTVIHMEVGEPDFVSPQQAIDAGIASLQAGKTHYTPALGIAELRRAVSNYYTTEYATNLDPDRVLITPGSSGALQLVTSMLVNPGDEVLMADPGYPCNRHFVRLAEGRAVCIPTGVESNYQIGLAHLEEHWGENTIAALVASPSNPTGTLIDHKELTQMAAFAADRGGYLIVDEIYLGLTYDDKVRTAVDCGDNVFVISSFSKYFGMTGWRIGWLVAPADLVRTLEKIAQNIFLSVSSPAQYAALAAFGTECRHELEKRKQEFKRRRDYLLPALRDLGFKIPVNPRGAFYLYADCSSLCDDSFEFAGRLLEEAAVAITPGLDFGNHLPEKHVRIAYTTSLEALQEGVRRMQKYLQTQNR